MPLTIGETVVNKLSGPVSFYIFYPSKEELQDFPKAPIFILFGDVHCSNKNYCNPSFDKGIGNYRMNAHFLKLISDAVSKCDLGNDLKDEDEIVDFYLEGGPFHRKLDEGKGAWPEKTPMHDLWKLFNACYDNIRMGRKPED